MTTTVTHPSVPTTAAADPWAAQLDQLKARYPKVREPILVALHILMRNPEIDLDDAKAQAALYDVRITAASVNAARRLLSRQDGPSAAGGDEATKAATRPAAKPTRPARRPRATTNDVDTEALIRGVVEKIEGQGTAEAERLREAIRKAVAVLEAAVRA